MALKLMLLLLVGVVAGVPHHASRTALDNVHFLLWTRSNPGDDQYNKLEEGNQASLGHFKRRDPTVVLVHGFSNTGCENWVIDAKTELLKHGSYNVISVDWGKLAAAPWYPLAVSYIPKVGAHTARLLDWLHEAVGMDAAGVQVVGHSLGAHLAGAVGQNLRTFRLPFITGLDPAGPEFYGKPDSSRLDKTDAEFVQIIHTNGGDLGQSCVGLETEIGHVDFFPNGGQHQPGCTIGGEWIDLLTGGCSHGRAHIYWNESINGNPAFVSHPCIDWDAFMAGNCETCGLGCLEMGFHVDRSLRGTYFLATNRHYPFAQGFTRTTSHAH